MLKQRQRGFDGQLDLDRERLVRGLSDLIRRFVDIFQRNECGNYFS